jgi:ADP-ribose pyrophosphatase YjhB (NUDIX family)
MWQLGAFCIISNDSGHVLLSHRRDLDVWNLPGGGVEQDETPWDAAVREVSEETGLEVAIERLVGIYTKSGRNGITLCFECIVTGGSLRASDEADEHRYFPIENLPQRLSPNQREYIRDMASQTTPVMRRQKGPATREWLKTLG